MFHNLREAKDFCAEKGISMVDFMMVDLNGRWRHLTMPVDRLTEDTLASGVGFDGSNYGFAPVESSDMVFIPDLSNAFLDEFAQVPTLAMIGDVFVIDVPDNRRFDQDPRMLHCTLRNICKNWVLPMKCGLDRNLNFMCLTM